jgi:hypothetical protein
MTCEYEVFDMREHVDMECYKLWSHHIKMDLHQSIVSFPLHSISFLEEHFVCDTYT